MKYSRDLLELRDKESKLVKVKRYEEAEKIKMKADLLEEFERNKLEAEVSNLWFEFSDASRFAEERGKVAEYIVTRFGGLIKAYSAGPKRTVKAPSTGQPTSHSKKQEHFERLTKQINI
jgi:hypothetical protein